MSNRSWDTNCGTPCIATCCPIRMVEHPKSKSTQPCLSPEAPDCINNKLCEVLYCQVKKGPKKGPTGKSLLNCLPARCPRCHWSRACRWSLRREERSERYSCNMLSWQKGPLVIEEISNNSCCISTLFITLWNLTRGLNPQYFDTFHWTQPEIFLILTYYNTLNFDKWTQSSFHWAQLETFPILLEGDFIFGFYRTIFNLRLEHRDLSLDVLLDLEGPRPHLGARVSSSSSGSGVGRLNRIMF